jgi:hypothetical protein
MPYLPARRHCSGDSRGRPRRLGSGVRAVARVYHGRYVLPCIRSLSQLAAVYPPKTHVVLGAHVRPFPIRKLRTSESCDITVPHHVVQFLVRINGTDGTRYTYHGTNGTMVHQLVRTMVRVRTRYLRTYVRTRVRTTL